jgi:Domain of unknown function (DUF5615)
MAHFYANENFPLPVVEELRRLGHDVLTSLDAGNANQKIPDGDVLSYASKKRRAVLTLNRRDFMRLHRASPLHAGIVACTTDADYVGQVGRITLAVSKLATLGGQFVRVYRPA